MTCPLCAHAQSRVSWIGKTVYRGKTFTYLECLSCRSLYCDPMPDSSDLAAMYSSDYADSFHGDENMGGARGVSEVLKWLSREGGGRFVDYGCGAGNLLAVAKDAGWEVLGVEMDQALAARLAQQKRLPVVTRDKVQQGSADILHLGDVIEHLTELDKQLPDLLSLLKSGGLLLAQGPLENNANLFHGAVRLARRVRAGRVIEMPPYHVLLTTAAGQRALFRRIGLSELQFEVWEDSWPAPAKLTGAQVLNGRAIALYGLRRCSQLLSRRGPESWGNRYFYAGRA